MLVENALYPTPEQMASFFGATEDGPFVMVNLLKFKTRAAYEDGSGGELTGAEAYALYGREVAKLIVQHGGRVRFSGQVAGLMLGQCDPLWDAVALAEYPSYAAFKAMALSPEYMAIARHRAAGLEGQLNIRTKASFDQL